MSARKSGSAAYLVHRGVLVFATLVLVAAATLLFAGAADVLWEGVVGAARGVRDVWINMHWELL